MSDHYSILKHDVIYDGRVFRIIRDEVQHKTGYHTVREVVQHNGGAVVVPLFPDNEVLLIKQFRYPVQKEIWELPAGKLDANEDPLECARRELQEETGWHAEKLEHLTSIMTTPGFCSEVLHIYLATGLTPGEQHLEQGEESIQILRLPLVQALAMCQSGEVADGKTVTGLMLAAMKAGVLVTSL